MCKLQIALIMVLFLRFSRAISNQSQLCETNLTWSQNGVLIAGGFYVKNASQKLSYPTDLAFDSKWNLYVADSDSHRILMYSNNATADQIPTIVLSNVSCNNLFIDKYDNLYFNDVRSIKIFNITSGNVTLFADSYPNPIDNYLPPFSYVSGLYVDSNLRVYVLDSGNRIVVRFLPGKLDNGTILVHRLQSPQCIFVDETDNNSLYICDSNFRILKYTNDGLNLKIVAGGTVPLGSSDLNALMYPSSIIIDSVNQQMYIADSGNHRIVKWSLSNDTKQGELVMPWSTTLWTPNAMKFDKDKNLYVAYGLIHDGQILKHINCCNNNSQCENSTSRSSKFAASLHFLQWIIFVSFISYCYLT